MSTDRDPQQLIAEALGRATGDQPEFWLAEAAGVVTVLRSAGLLLEPGGETRTEEIRDAVRRLGHGLIAVSPLLDKPYSDAPEWTPWSRFVHPRLVELRRLVGIDRPADTEEQHHGY